MSVPAPSSALRRMAPPLLILSGLGLIGAGAAVQILMPDSQIMAQLGLSGTVFGLAAKMGGAIFFGGLFALAAVRPATDRQPPPAKAADPGPSATVTAAALRAARMARERRESAQA